MKTKHLYLVICAFVISLSLKAQDHTICANETVKLHAGNHQEGILQWQISSDMINWKDITGERGTTYIFTPTFSAYYRVLNKFPNCDPQPSAVTLVQVPPKVNITKNRLANGSYTYITGSPSLGANITWSILEGENGEIESPNSRTTKFNGEEGEYKLLYTLQNECGTSSDTLTIDFLQPIFYDKIVVVDETDTFLSSEEETEAGNFIIEFNDPVPSIDNETILIGLMDDGFMRKVETVSSNGAIFTMTTTQAFLEDVLVGGGLEVGQLYEMEPINETFSTDPTPNILTRAELLSNPIYQQDKHIFHVSDSFVPDSSNVSLQTFSDDEDEEVTFSLFNFDDKELFNHTGTNSNINIRLDGGLTFTPNLIADYRVNYFPPRLDYAHVGLNNGLFEFDATLTTTANGELSSENDGLDHSFTIGTVKRKYIVTLLGIPTVVTVKIVLNGEFYYAITGNVLHELNVNNKTFVNTGFYYNHSLNFTPYFSLTNEFELSKNFEATVSIEAGVDVGPVFNVTLNGIIGGYVDSKLTHDNRLSFGIQNSNFYQDQEANVGLKITPGFKATLLSRNIFDYHFTRENRKLNTYKRPAFFELVSGNRQNITNVEHPFKVRVLDNLGRPASNIPVYFEVLEDSGSLSHTSAITDENGIAETNFTPDTGISIGKVSAHVKDASFKHITNSPILFYTTSPEEEGCGANSTLSASYDIENNALVAKGVLGEPPYTIEVNEVAYTAPIPLSEGESYNIIVTDANNCIAQVSYSHGVDSCNDLSVEAEVFGNSLTAQGSGGTPPYQYAIVAHSPEFGEFNVFNDLPIGNVALRIKDANECINFIIVEISSDSDQLIAYFDAPPSVDVDQNIQFNNYSNNATSFSWDFGDGQSSTDPHPQHAYTTDGTYTVTLTASSDTDSSEFTKEIMVGTGTSTDPDYPPGTVHCNGTPTAVVDVTNPITGKTWMDRNLGASQAATSSTDVNAYGDLYQWGRGADGHQCRTSPTTSTLSSTDQPGHGNFILSNSGANWDWRSPQNTNLWQGVNGVNNPCPSGYRLPTEQELNAERQSWSSNNAAGAFASPLKLSLAGYRVYSGGSLFNVGTNGRYWSSTVSGSSSRHLGFSSGGAVMSTTRRAYGRSVRCLKD